MLQVVLVVAANQQMRSTTNLLIINLAMADLLFIVFCVPFTATDYVLPFWPFGDAWCKIVQYLIVVTAYASVYTLVLMSLDRFLAVVHPITSMSVSATELCSPRPQATKARYSSSRSTDLKPTNSMELSPS
jgi:allatostatin receptor